MVLKSKGKKFKLNNKNFKVQQITFYFFYEFRNTIDWDYKKRESETKLGFFCVLTL